MEYARLRGLVVADNYRLTDVLIYRFNDFMSSLRQIKPLIIKLWSMPRIVVDAEKVKREEQAYRSIPVITDFTDAGGNDRMKEMN